MNQLKFPLIFGSASAMRLKLLHKINIVPQEIVKHDIDEMPHMKELPRVFTERMAQEKMRSIYKKVDRTAHLIITVDTVVACGRRIMQKPIDADQARDFLHLLSGRRHKVFTAMCFSAPDREKLIIKISITILRFKSLQSQEIEKYIDSGDWQGKAGGYGIQGFAISFIEWINGNPDAVAGLPLCMVGKLLENYIKQN